MKVQGLLDLDLDGAPSSKPASQVATFAEGLGRDSRSNGSSTGRTSTSRPARRPRSCDEGSSRTDTLWDVPLSGLTPSRPSAPPVTVAGRRLQPTPVFDTYWRFAAKRQAVYEARVAGLDGPWTDDPILSAHRFTNCYRAADRVSQFLISDVLYHGDQSPREVVFRALLFKLFNKIGTWNRLKSAVGMPSWRAFDFDAYDRVLSSALDQRQTLYSAAYVMPPPHLGEHRKHQNHLRLLELMLHDDAAEKAHAAGSLRSVYELLRSYPALGPFLAFQLTIDLNYSSVVNFPESDFVVAGPGARDGIRKCFGEAPRGAEEELIHYMVETQDEHFERLGLEFNGLAGQRPLQPIDCQNLFCEVDKYARVAHPEISGVSGRTRIKQRYRRDLASVTAWFPPKWGINQLLPSGA
ncbi:nucleotide kinase domain-containing protein [Actinomycetospora atypica]|uniref:Nucleotide kinase domain-containing protein n=1 Tax=Actinomycetospora atypica TaxID=1290095 RepID=A0ABV9YG46_9PSEU